VYGEARFDRDFSGGSDQVTYRIAVPPAAGTLTVTGRLLYQPVSYRFVRDLRTDSTPEVGQFGQYYDAADQSPSVLALAQASAKRP
jgi:hypothetical protein